MTAQPTTVVALRVSYVDAARIDTLAKVMGEGQVVDGKVPRATVVLRALLAEGLPLLESRHRIRDAVARARARVRQERGEAAVGPERAEVVSPPALRGGRAHPMGGPTAARRAEERARRDAAGCTCRFRHRRECKLYGSGREKGTT